MVAKNLASSSFLDSSVFSGRGMAGSRLIHRINFNLLMLLIFPHNFPTASHNFPMLFFLPDLRAILRNLQQSSFRLLQCLDNHLLILGGECLFHININGIISFL